MRKFKVQNSKFKKTDSAGGNNAWGHFPVVRTSRPRSVRLPYLNPRSWSAGTRQKTEKRPVRRGRSQWACHRWRDFQAAGVAQLTHLTDSGEARMVDVSAKPALTREAVAQGEILLAPATLDLIESNQVGKGNVLATARLAGILAAKKTGELIPLCHPLPLTHCGVNFDFPATRDRIGITATTRIVAGTGVEMEALTAVSVAALTIYDMCKAVDKAMVIGGIRLISKTKTSRDVAPPSAS